jgi:cyclophilin family peptidyl-prolyl cis-trans isomerase
MTRITRARRPPIPKNATAGASASIRAPDAPQEEITLKKTLIAAVILGLVACAKPVEQQTGTQTESTSTTSSSATSTTSTATETTASGAAVTPPPPAAAKEEQKQMSSYDNKVAELHTSQGEIDIRFFPDVAPNHVKNFLDLAEKGFYNGTKFHRVIPGFMIQGGDPNTVSGSPASWGTGGSGKNVAAEFSKVPHKRGIVSMARSNDPNSASSQFFIVTTDSTFLDNQYTVFGQVTKGMDVADKIVNAPKGAADRPNSPVAIESIKIRDAREDEKGPTPK